MIDTFRDISATPCTAVPSVHPTASYLLQCTSVLGWKFEGCAAATGLCVFGNADWGLWQAVTQGLLSKSQFWFLMFPESKKKKERKKSFSSHYNSFRIDF